jgi:hypothetical protein
MKRRILVSLSCAFLFAALAAFLAAFFEPTAQANGGAAASAGATYQRGARNVTGTVVGIGGRFAGRSRPFRLIVNSYTSPGDVERLNSALRSGGDDELLRALSGLNAGRIQLGDGVGVTANAIIATPQAEGGTKLTVFFERNVTIYEMRYGTRSADYRFGYAEIFLDGRGRGEGTFIGAARVRLRDGNTWEVEDFGAFPARIMGVRSTGSVPAR